MSDKSHGTAIDRAKNLCDSVDRIVLRRVENDRLHGWVAALNARFEGMIRVTKSDIANFLVRRHADDLSESEIKAIEADLFDEVRWLSWALGKVRQAKKAGQSLSLNDLMVKCESTKNRNGSASKGIKARTRKKPGPVESIADQGPEGPDYAALEEG